MYIKKNCKLSGFAAAQVQERKEREAAAKERERGAELEQVGRDFDEGEEYGDDHQDGHDHEGCQLGNAQPGDHKSLDHDHHLDHLEHLDHHDHYADHQEEHEGEQWGKAGPGGAYWRPCAVTGQGFLDKMVNTDGDDIFLGTPFYRGGTHLTKIDFFQLCQAFSFSLSPKVPIFRCQKMRLRAPESTNGVRKPRETPPKMVR